MTRHTTLGLLLATCALPLIAACGGGDSSGAAPFLPTPAPSSSDDPVWQQGVFPPSSSFEAQCEVVRTGRDIRGNTFPDRAGSTLREMFWQRSYSDETYLWYDEITDRNPAQFTDKIAYFDELRTAARTPSGAPKDQFHGTADTAEYLQQSVGGSTSGYGLDLVFFSATRPRDVRVAFTETGSPADQAGILRGTKILTVDGESVETGTDTDKLNNGLFPRTNGEEHTFGVELPDGTRRDITLTSGEVEIVPVNETEVITVDGRRYGYVHFTTFSPANAEVGLFDAFDALAAADVDDVVLDLRYNGGGRLSIAGQLAYMIGGSNTNGADFYRLRFNDKAGAGNPVTGGANTPTPFIDTGTGLSVPNSRRAPTLNKQRVFVLTTDDTCSASEAVMNGLRGADIEVIQIGGRTCGKPFGFYPTDNCGTTYFTIQFQGVNDKGFGDYADGFAPNQPVGQMGDTLPGCDANDDLSRALGDPDEAMLSTAIAYAETGECPASAAAAKPDVPLSAETALDDPSMDLLADPRIALRTLLDERIILPDESNR